jgi:Ca2+-binding RTX toxin-like protein
MATITGTAGDDTLFSTAGNDTITGLGGVDTVSYANMLSRVSVNLGLAGVAQNTLGGGVDTLISIENVIGSAFNDILYAANAGGGALYGGNGDDTIYASAGADTIDGGAGTNWADYYLGGITAGVTVDLTKQGSVQDTGGGGLDLLNNIQNIQGSSFDDLLIGDAHNNNLQGRVGDDTLDGGAGDDVLNGGPGVNTATYADATSAVNVSLAITTAQNTGGAGSDTLGNIQNLVGSNFSDVLTGDGNNNYLNGGAMEDTLYGGAGDDTLNGGAGGDHMYGGTGIDTLTYADAIGSITMNLSLSGAQNTGASGFDVVAQIENLIGSPFDDSLTGTGGANTIYGGDGDDTIQGGGGNDVLFGDTGKDLIKGGSGDDTITGGGGSDTIQGGVGADHFVYTGIAESLPSAPDDLADFQSGVDKIDLSQMDANALVDGQQHFTIVSAFDGNAGELILANHKTFYLVQGDVNGDSKMDFEIYVNSATLKATDFIL